MLLDACFVNATSCIYNTGYSQETFMYSSAIGTCNLDTNKVCVYAHNASDKLKCDGGVAEADSGASAPVAPSVATPLLCIP